MITLGMDIGSTASKCVLLKDGVEIIGQALTPSGIGTDGPRQAYCYMMGGTTGVVTYLYRKYGNIWVGVLPCCIFAGIFTLASFTLSV